MANIRVIRTDGPIDTVLLYSIQLEYNNDSKWTNDFVIDDFHYEIELLQHIVNIELIQPVCNKRNNGCKTSIITPNTRIRISC